MRSLLSKDRFRREPKVVSTAENMSGPVGRGTITAPRAIALAFLASMSAFEGRPRFFGSWVGGLAENERELFEDGLGWICIILSAPD